MPSCAVGAGIVLHCGRSEQWTVRHISICTTTILQLWKHHHSHTLPWTTGQVKSRWLMGIMVDKYNEHDGWWAWWWMSTMVNNHIGWLAECLEWAQRLVGIMVDEHNGQWAWWSMSTMVNELCYPGLVSNKWTLVILESFCI